MSKLVCLSGLDGSGKTTQVELLKNHFQSCGLRVCDIHLKYVEISMPKIKGKGRKYIEERKITDSDTVRNVFSAINFVEKVKISILPSLNENDIIIMNRYIDSARCYHYLKNCLSDYVNDIYDALPSPAFNLFIDVPPEVCYARIESRKIFNEFESLENLKRAYEFYKKSKERFLWIDGQRDKEIVLNSIIENIELKNGDSIL